MPKVGEIPKLLREMSGHMSTVGNYDMRTFDNEGCFCAMPTSKRRASRCRRLRPIDPLVTHELSARTTRPCVVALWPIMPEARPEANLGTAPTAPTAPLHAWVPEQLDGSHSGARDSSRAQTGTRV